MLGHPNSFPNSLKKLDPQCLLQLVNLNCDSSLRIT